jgi:hypothetical protein
MKFALSRMIVPLPLIVGLGLAGCTGLTKQEHIELHKELQKEMMSDMKTMMKEMNEGK